MNQLIQDLLKLSRSSRQPLKKEMISQMDLVREALKDLYRLQDGRQIDIKVEELAPCLADRTLFKQVWINLLSNALKFTRKRDLARIEIGCKVSESQACRVGNADTPNLETMNVGAVKPETVYYIRDNGVGFDMTDSSRLFGAFRRLHSDDEYEGTGVGLAIVDRIIRRHGGRIWAEAAVGQGAAFYFTVGT